MKKFFADIKRKNEELGYKKISGPVKILGDMVLGLAVLAYVVIAGGVLPFYIKSFHTLGTDKSMAWLFGIKISGIILAVALAILLLALILKWIFVKGEFKEDILRVKNGSLRRYVSPAHIFGAVFLISILLSYFLSEYKEVALYGLSGWYNGTVQYAAIVIALFVIPCLCYSGRLISAVLIFTSFGVCYLGLLMDLFGNIIGREGWSASKVSTIGNANWFCGYMVTVLFIGMIAFFLDGYMAGGHNVLKKNLLRVYLFICAYMYLSQGSASGILALGVVVIILLMLSGKDMKMIFRVSELAVIFAAAECFYGIVFGLGLVSRTNDELGRMIGNLGVGVVLLVVTLVLALYFNMELNRGNGKKKTGKEISLPIGKILFVLMLSSFFIYVVLTAVNTASGGKLLGASGPFIFSQNWGSGRGTSMTAAVRMIREMTLRELLVGTGPDTFYPYLTGGRNPEVDAYVASYFSSQGRLTNAHCEVLNMIITTGFLGAASFFGMLISAAAGAMKILSAKAKKLYGTDMNNEGDGILDMGYAASVCLIAYMVNNLVSFQTSVNLSQLSLVLSLGVWAVTKTRRTEKK